MPDFQEIRDKSSYALNVLRDNIVRARRACRSENIEQSLQRDFEGALTLHIRVLWHSVEESKKKEIEQYDEAWGRTGLHFQPRGIGSDNTPGCFVCGGEEGLHSNIAAFVPSREEGLKVLGLFTSGAFLDYRESEPTWVQVKVGACAEHQPNLEYLQSRTAWYNRIWPQDVKAAMEMEGPRAEAFRIEMLVVRPECSLEEAERVLERSFLQAEVMASSVADIGEWSDDHPLNTTAKHKLKEQFASLFPTS